MGQLLEAIYENGILRLLEKPDLAENQRVVLELVESRGDLEIEEYLGLCHRVYEGLSDADIADVEAIALDRSRFRTRQIDV